MKQGANVHSAKLKFFALITIFILLVGIAIYLHTKNSSQHNTDKSRIEQFRDKKDSPGIFLFTYVILSFLPIPFAPAYFAAALIYPFGVAAILTFLGNIIFSIILFWIVRGLGREYIEYLIRGNEKYKRFEEKFEENAFLNIFLLRLFWIIPMEIIGLMSGVSKVKFRTYLSATILGNIPLVIFTSMIMRTAIKDRPVLFLLAGIAMLIMLAIPFIVLPEIRHFIRDHLFKKKNKINWKNKKNRSKT